VLERLLAPAWPPIVALLAAVAVFLGVLLTTPPGLAAPFLLLFTPSDPRSLAASYAAGAAASLSLGTLLVLAPALALLDFALRWARAHAAR
jgi:hypothetical protein